MSHASLEEKLQAAGSPVDLARNSQIGPYVYPKVPAEFSNWRDEQVAWRETSRALRPEPPHDRPLHRGTGRDPAPLRARRELVRELRRQQGEAVRRLQPGRLRDRRRRSSSSSTRTGSTSSGAPPPTTGCSTTARPAATTSDFERDERTAVNPTGKRKIYRFQVQGPNAMQALEKATGGPLPEIKFFNMG